MVMMYPAIKAKMGSWNYYMVRMSMGQVASTIDIAADFYKDTTLSRTIQRKLRDSRSKEHIAQFLAHREDRFLGSLVVAAVGGDPDFVSLSIADQPEFRLYQKHLEDTFGVLEFNGEQKYYALDGQHRLFAIKYMLDPSYTGYLPEDFRNETISVLMVCPEPEPGMSANDLASNEKFLQSYRRLFSSLNRYAKSTDPDTNIIMDEDDSFAINTRRLMSEHSFFQCNAEQERLSERVKTDGKNLATGDSYFTSLQTLYDLNIQLLLTIDRANKWPAKKELDAYKRFRPSEDELDSMYHELTVYWDGLIKALPVLSEDPAIMRFHNPKPGSDDGAGQDNLLFWPIGQEIIVPVIRSMLNYWHPSDTPTVDSVAKAIESLGIFDWSLHSYPWNYLLRIPGARPGTFKIQSQQSKPAISISRSLIRWIIGLDELSAADVEGLRVNFRQLSEYPQDMAPNEIEKTREESWQEVERLKDLCSQLAN